MNFKTFAVTVIIMSIIMSMTSFIQVPAHLAHAANGDLVTKIKFHDTAGKPVQCQSGVGVGIAFDGNDLWFSCFSTQNSSDLYRADPNTGLVTGSFNIANGLGALAYDSANNAIWAGWGGGQGGAAVRLIHLSASSPKTVTSTEIKFSPPEFSNSDLDDGIAYDGQTQMLYISPDGSTIIHQYDIAGNHITDFNWAGSSCYNSGLAIGGKLLYEGADGCNHVYVVDKNNPGPIVFDFATNIGNDRNFRDEDLECDSNTFSTGPNPKHVMWSVEAYEPRRAAAFEIPFNSCGTGGQPPSSAICPESNVQHWDKIIFMITDPQLAKRANLTANTELDIKVLDDPHSVADIKHKVLDFLNQSYASPKSIRVLQVEYAIICAAQSIPTHGEKPAGFLLGLLMKNITETPSTMLAMPKAESMKNITETPSTMLAMPKAESMKNITNMTS